MPCETFLSWWVLLGWHCYQLQGTRAHCMVGYGWTWCTPYAMAFTHWIPNQLNTYGRFWSDLRQCSPPPSSQHQLRGYLFGRIVFIPTVQYQSIGRMYRVQHQGVLKLFWWLVDVILLNLSFIFFLTIDLVYDELAPVNKFVSLFLIKTLHTPEIEGLLV